MSNELFSVVQFFKNGQYERLELPDRWMGLTEAVRWARSMATSVGAKIGTTERVIITDQGDETVWMWEYGKGMVWPVAHDVPDALRAHEPQEFDCSECGRHTIDVSGIVLDAPLCAACIHVPRWYDNPEVARILDPEHSRTRT